MAAVRPAQPVPTMTTFSTLADMGMKGTTERQHGSERNSRDKFERGPSVQPWLKSDFNGGRSTLTPRDVRGEACNSASEGTRLTVQGSPPGSRAPLYATRSMPLNIFGICVEKANNWGQTALLRTPHMLFFKRILGMSESDDAPERRGGVRYTVGLKFPMKVI